jgi:hypothetical protein
MNNKEDCMQSPREIILLALVTQEIRRHMSKLPKHRPYSLQMLPPLIPFCLN